MSYNILVRKESNDMGDELCPAGRAVAQPTSALFHGDTVFLHDLDDVCLSFSRRVIAALLCVCIQTAYVRFKVQLSKRKIPPTQRSDGFCRVNRRQNRSGVLRGGIGTPHSVLNKRKCERRQ